MDRFIAEQNIAHYKRLLATELDEQKRQAIRHLLVDEEAKLHAMEEKPRLNSNSQPRK
ncbi:hypothetical protein [Bradyrhizobium guangdongense]|uniref:hypothetical protein n=1 Tax=Bradyrhizobium guangdongense TaxID=1325090 RepID=UPI0016433B2B|nr:hypothetical protein [Bradyrhizobium guangdongense]